MDTCPFWETVMMCSLADMTLLYATRISLYDRTRTLYLGTTDDSRRKPWVLRVVFERSVW
jgi:hypothetical protein